MHPTPNVVLSTLHPGDEIELRLRGNTITMRTFLRDAAESDRQSGRVGCGHEGWEEREVEGPVRFFAELGAGATAELLLR